MKKNEWALKDRGMGTSMFNHCFLYGMVRHRHLDEELFSLREKGGTKRETKHG